MKILIIHAHTANRGDEAAVKAMVDELLNSMPDLEITISINGKSFYPAMNTKVKQIGRFPAVHSVSAKIEYPLFLFTNGKVCFTKNGKDFKQALFAADLVIHAPGGPSIGDIYMEREKNYLERLNLVRKLGKKYMFYAPSMGPFEKKAHNRLRRKVLLYASKIIVRDPISQEYVQKFIPEKDVKLALDSALQHDIDEKMNEEKFQNYQELKRFFDAHKQVVGVTVTDLLWHPKYGKQLEVSKNIKDTFQKFLQYLVSTGTGVLFIPQLYGTGNDSNFMKSFMYDPKHFFIVKDNEEQYDAYFQQYVISKLYAVIGMRYHSNIFSAKMGIPFISVSYEQKMKGFMNKIGLEKYCIGIEQLEYELLRNKYELMRNDHDAYQKKLQDLHVYMRNESYKTTKIVKNILEENNLSEGRKKDDYAYEVLDQNYVESVNNVS